MNCRLCGYWYSEHDEQGSTCGHCGGNRNGLTRTRLMMLSKAFALAAVLLLPVLCLIYREDFAFEIQKLSGKLSPDELEGRSGTIDILWIFIVEYALSIVFLIPGILRQKRCSCGLFTAAAVIMLLAAVYGVLGREGIVFALPFLFNTAAAVTAKIDKKKQIKTHKRSGDEKYD